MKISSVRYSYGVGHPWPVRIPIEERRKRQRRQVRAAGEATAAHVLPSGQLATRDTKSPKFASKS